MERKDGRLRNLNVDEDEVVGVEEVVIGNESVVEVVYRAAVEATGNET